MLQEHAPRASCRRCSWSIKLGPQSHGRFLNRELNRSVMPFRTVKMYRFQRNSSNFRIRVTYWTLVGELWRQGWCYLTRNVGLMLLLNKMNKWHYWKWGKGEMDDTIRGTFILHDEMTNYSISDAVIFVPNFFPQLYHQYL